MDIVKTRTTGLVYVNLGFWLSTAINIYLVDPAFYSALGTRVILRPTHYAALRFAHQSGLLIIFNQLQLFWYQSYIKQKSEVCS